jgi:FkbM family methyltransferase
MLSSLKSTIRDALPRRYQVPLKFWYSKLRGDLEDEMTLLPKLLSPSDCVIDIGANRGVYAYSLARLGANVELFEPNPACAQILASWAAKRPSVHLHPFALSDHEGTAELLIPVDAAGVEHDASASIEKSGNGDFREQVVPLATLDSFQFGKVALIKIDVEGHEFSVLKGAQKTIASAKPALLIEIERRHTNHPFLATFNWLHDQGYKAFFLDEDILRPVDEFDVDRDQPIENLGIQNAKYINNFLFLHASRLDNGSYAQLFDCWGQR